MDTSLTNNDDQQLIQMSVLSPDDNNIVVMRETTSLNTTTNNINDIKKQTIEDIKQQRFFLRLFSWPMGLLPSLHLPHFSDRSLRIIFLIFITLIGLTSFANALIVGSSVVQFKQQCPLYASFKFETITTTQTNWTVRIEPSSEKFSSQSTCDFCTFYNVFTFIYTIMTGFFFVLFNGDHRIVTTNDRCLIIPWFPISIVLGFLALVNASILTNGFLIFCGTITSSVNSRINSCTQLNQIVFEQYPNVSMFFLYMLLAIIFSWFQLAFFIGVIAILTIRLGSSFDWNKDSNKQQLNDKPISIIIESVDKI